MLLVIDVGNTNTVMGVFDGTTLVEACRIRTIRETTVDEFNILARALFADKEIDISTIERTVISSVVPPINSILDTFARRYISKPPLWIDPDSVRRLMPILYDNPSEVGADRIVNAVAAYERYKTSLIIIDFGTATTFDAISARGEYLGGAITPGVKISAEALFQKASKLPRVEIFRRPENVIGKNTVESMKSGIIYGNGALVDGMVHRMAKEMGSTPKVIATGGLAGLIAEASETIEVVDNALTLEGLRIIADHSA
jgi:type III pantothenate kinase